MKIRNLNALLLKKEEELRREKELCVESEMARKTFEQQLRDAQARIDESDEHSKREARRINSKLEARVILFKLYLCRGGKTRST